MKASPLCRLIGKRCRRSVSLFALLFVLFSMPVKAQINVALGRPVTSSSIVAATPAANLTDGNATTVAGTANAIANPGTEWFQIDLGTESIIENIRITANPSNHNRGRRFLIMTWRDALGPGSLGDNPASYVGNALTVSRYNRLIYTAPGSVTTSAVFGGTIPGAAGATLGPDYTARTFNVGIHPARYVRIMALNDEPLELAEIEVFRSSIVPQRGFSNGNFEQGYAGAANTNSNIHEAAVNGWSTSEAVAMFSNTAPFNDPSNGSFMEFWSNNFLGVAANQGTYFVELNAYTNGSLSQQPICVLPGESFTWSFAHRGRDGVDVMRMVINGTDVAEFTDGNTAGSTHTSNVLQPATTTVTTQVPEAAGWTQYTGTWTNTTGAPLTVIFSFRAVSTSTGNVSVGNLMDDVSLVPLSALVTLSAAASFGPESIPTANLPRLLVNGTVTLPATVQVNITGGTATRGVDYTTTPAAGPLVVTIPAGVYDGTAATGISLAPYLQIVTDGLAEPAETILLQLQAPVGVAIPVTGGCVTGTTANTYTIADAADITGNVFNDANGAVNSLIDGVAYTGLQLYVNVVDVNGLIVATTTVNTVSGAYAVTGIVAGDYSVQLSTNLGTIGQQAPLVVLPAGWVYTGEGSAGAGDALPDGHFSVSITGVNATVNFGVERPPVATTANPTIPTQGLNVRLTLDGAGGNPPAPAATDAEDGPLGTGATIVINQLPTNTILYYNNVAVTAGQVITGFNPALLQVAFGIPAATAYSTSFSFSYHDAAGMTSLPVTYTLNWLAALPVTFTQVLAELQQADVLVSWQTAQEVGNDRFEVEYSTDGISFTMIGSVKGSGVTPAPGNYQFRHAGAALLNAKTLYYRLKQVDLDGQSAYSKTARVGLQAVDAVRLVPNPVRRGSQLVVTGKALQEIAIFNLAGKRVWHSRYNGSQSSVTVPTTQLLPGSYLVYVNKAQLVGRVVVVE
ncbi:T9SS type A sorting domain-containing protein [Paraflavitalea pollutisoli]|uniref:T9SS type A sorting domain-containing protein n=1 Tax=Paraflavitalea pollutisoli TaxID=3034143 RepID=UPI0023ED65C8|nr:T9SS type A sorting domain-containing protein [Paraflavitalea sp. H1-2-19X]